MKKLMFLSDTHYPYHSAPAMSLFFKVARSVRPDIIIHGGDHWDFWSISRFAKRKAHLRLSLLEEMKLGLESLSQLAKSTRELHFIAGNHDDRLERDLASRNPQYQEVLEHFRLDLPGLVAQAGCASYTPYLDGLQLGKIFYTHDIDRMGEYAVHQSAKDAHCNILLGHNHIMDYTIGGNALGESKLAASFGWMGDVAQIDYRARLKARRQWSLGFGVGYMLDDGITFWQPVPIVKNMCVVEGRLFSA
jgi:predicted phosphodiesterase